VAIGVAALAGLAIAKEKIVIADLARRNRGYKTIKPIEYLILMFKLKYNIFFKN